ncbi:uncharacterized protein LOC126834863 [Adelges cooleyi]|uniref:uncharacterized protein LOC126834863 n=1 Tax=Adelges cooleyi TaxID=133065 RepID=UPI00218023BD|nr:uncharacterized protein LOC126834863 [Adelges cooleyi]XP_050423033.1 uncharacterized protein LOC126834863 [Adelges cooleyi]XP_050423041.1 uncharacterized protein LOC126834863 [Adelges cooleyi]
MSEGRFPSYHHLPPAAPAPQRHHLSTAATSSIPHPLTFQPPPISHQLSTWLAKKDLAAYRNTPYTSLHNVAALQMHKPEPIIDRWMDARNNMPPPSRPGPPSPSPAHAANSTSVKHRSSFALSVDQLDLTNHKKESQQVSMDLSAHKTEKPFVSKTIAQLNGQVVSSKAEEKAISVIAPNPLKVVMSETKGNDIPLILKSDTSYIHKVKNNNNSKKDSKLTKLPDIKCHNTNLESPSKIDITVTNHVEKMLENIFQVDESEKQSVIKSVKPAKSPSPSSMRAESVEKVLKSPSPSHKSDHEKLEDSISPEKSSKIIHDKHSQFLEVENKLEELFASVESPNKTDQPSVLEDKSKPLITTKRPYSKNKKPMKKIKRGQSISEKTKPVEAVVKKYKGPLIRVSGNIDNPTSFVVVNRNIQEDEDSLDGRNINKKTYLYKSGVSNGEEKPDVGTLESSGWQCVFCSRGPHVRDIGYDPTGDLFGPYYVSLPKNVVKKTDNAKRKKSKSNLHDNDTSDIFIEVWTHENCLVWASGVYMVGTKIFGLEDSVRAAKNTTCVYCGTNGASIGCTARHCKSSIHFSCAIQLGWLLDNQTFLTTCNLHKNSPKGTSCH